MCVQVRKKHFNALLTTYELLMSDADRARLVKIKWAGIVVDEGHRWVRSAQTDGGVWRQLRTCNQEELGWVDSSLHNNQAIAHQACTCRECETPGA
jgi:hypothetical protein